ncbi:MAG: hypothetical protein A2539_04390 [Elusimicrobia bacterium RIFOXYD2_FULL_34_15]|nr:MAG: hypothetical protein A2539_04390 [Elusimicrobia bacterium RIFOXYD2_FULL_34_15]
MKIKLSEIPKKVRFTCATFSMMFVLISCSIASQLTDIITKSEPNSDSISIIVSSKTKFNVYRIQEPNRIVIELSSCEYVSDKKDLQVNSQFIKSIRGGQYTDAPVKKSRIIVDLSKPAKYSSKATATEITIDLTAKVTNSKTATPKAKKVETAKTDPAPGNTPVDGQKPAAKKVIKEKTLPIKKIVQKPIKHGELPKDIVTLDFNNADIKDVFQILAIKTGMNIIYSDDVSGNLTIHLENVPFNEAMNLILQMQGLILQQVGSNVIRIMTPATLAKERADAIQVSQVFRLNYSKAVDISGKISSIMSAEGQKVSLQTDERTNSIIVTSTPEGIQAALSLMNKLDVKPEQVVIEAKIVEISIGDTKDIGIDWSLTRDIMNNSNSRISENAQSQTPSQSQVGSFTFGYLRSDIELTARLAAAQSKGRAKILSQPRIATLNNMLAKIVVGGQIPYTQTSIGSGGVSTTSTAFMTVGIQLEVTPTINVDGRITMLVRPNVSNVTRISAIGPETTTKEAETTVLVKNGETIVIGGLITNNERKDASQIPLLGDVPILGQFFKSYHDDKQNTELIIFVTPYIMKD